MLVNFDNVNRESTANFQREKNKSRLDCTIVHVVFTDSIRNIGGLSDKKPLVPLDQATGADLVTTIDHVRRLEVFTR